MMFLLKLKINAITDKFQFIHQRNNAKAGCFQKTKVFAFCIKMGHLCHKKCNGLIRNAPEKYWTKAELNGLFQV